MSWNGSGPGAVSVKPCRKKARWPFFAGVSAGIILVVSAVGWLAAGDRESDVDEEKPAATSRRRLTPGRPFADSPEGAVRKAMPAKVGVKQRVRRPRPPGEMFDHLQGEDRKLAEAVQSALDADSLKATISAAHAALKSENPEVRQHAVESLGWFGASALPELTGCMADPDDDVRQTAENQWEQALQEIDRPIDQFRIAAAAFATLSGEDALGSLGGLLGNAATEMIDGEDDEAVAADNRVAVLQALVDIIDGGRAENAEAAKAAYNDITGHEWMGIDEAERYLADPDNYDPDEPPAAEAAAETAEQETVAEPEAQGEEQTDDTPSGESATGESSEEDAQAADAGTDEQPE